MKNVTKNDIPNIEKVKEALLDVLASGRARAFAGIGPAVAKALGLSRGQRSYRIGKSKTALFENRLVRARVELVKAGAISFKAGRVKLAKREVPQSASASNLELSPITNPAGKNQKEPAVARVVKAPEERTTKCLSFQEPYASYIATGVKDAEFRTWKVNVPIRDLVVCASKTVTKWPEKISGAAYSKAIGMVDVTDCVWVGGEYAWKLENPRLIKPFEVHANAAFYYVSDIPEVISNTEESYREFILPMCHRGEASDEGEFIASLFSAKPDAWQRKALDKTDKFSNVKAFRH